MMIFHPALWPSNEQYKGFLYLLPVGSTRCRTYCQYNAMKQSYQSHFIKDYYVLYFHITVYYVTIVFMLYFVRGTRGYSDDNFRNKKEEKNHMQIVSIVCVCVIHHYLHPN